MKKFAALLLMLTFILLSACSNSSEAPPHQDNPDPTIQTHPYQDILDKLVGTWQNWGADQIISFVDYEHCVWVIGTRTETSSYVELIELTYKIVTDNTLIMTPITQGYAPGEYTFSISDNELTLFLDGYEEFCHYSPLQRVPDTNRTNCSIVGTWEAFGMDEPLYYDLYINGYRSIDNLTFYADGSCIFDGERHHKGFYTVVHDGNSVYVDEREYWNITIPCPDIMIIKFNDVAEQIYLAQ